MARKDSHGVVGRLAGDHEVSSVVSTLHKQSSMSNAPQGAVAHVASSVAVRIVAGTHVVGTALWA